MLQITRVLPGELEEDINPEDYGFDVVRDEPLDEAEADARVAALYAQVKDRTGIVIPMLEPLLPDEDEGERSETADPEESAT